MGDLYKKKWIMQSLYWGKSIISVKLRKNIYFQASHPVIPYFIFGDFNFRLNGRSVVDALDVELRVRNDETENDTDENIDTNEQVNKNG